MKTVNFTEMKNGVHKEGVHVLRAKIDMSHPNMLMRDPIIYRVLNNHLRKTNFTKSFVFIYAPKFFCTRKERFI